MTKEEFLEQAEVGEFRTLRYNSTSKHSLVNVYVYIKRVDEKNVLVMNDNGSFFAIGYGKIEEVV